VNELVSFKIWGAKAAEPVGLSHPRGWLHFVWFAIGGLLPLAAFFRKTFQNIKLTGDRVDLTNW
ncbi:MAG TPA: hypothetical protein VND93_12320, partial [Myxococcales bacterium]|nr:hypothetical protein [Myxococcales bacterium]